MAAIKSIYAAAGWWNEQWGRIKTLMFWLGVAGAVVLVVGGYLVHRFGVLGTIAIAIGGLFLLVSLASFVVGRNIRPKSVVEASPLPAGAIVTRGPDLRIGKTYSESRGAARGTNMQVIRAEVYNARDSGGEPATARDTVPFTEAFDQDWNLVANTRGSWGYDPFARAISTVTFRPTRETHPLEVAAKFIDQPDAWLPGARSPELPPGNYVMRISIRGDNLDVPAVFEWDVENPGADHEIAAKPREAPTNADIRQRKIDVLDTAITRGQQLFERRVETPEAWDRWLSDHGAWREFVNSDEGGLKQTLSTAEYHRANDIIDAPSSAPVGEHDYNPGHAISRVWIAARLKNLVNVLTDCQGVS